MHPCLLCTGRTDPTAPRDLPDMMSTQERVALLDPCFHSILSFPEGMSSVNRALFAGFCLFVFFRLINEPAEQIDNICQVVSLPLIQKLHLIGYADDKHETRK